MSSSPVAKRNRPAPSSVALDDSQLFKICFEQVTPFKQLVEVVGTVLNGRVYMRLQADPKDADSVFLTIDTIDSEHVCVVQATLVCTGRVAEEDVSFCVDTQTVAKCLHNVQTHHHIELIGTKRVADILMRSVDPVTKDEDLSFDLHTFEEEWDPQPLEDLEYTFEHDMDLAQFKRIVKMAGSLKCDNVKIAMYTKKGKKTGEVKSVTVMSGAGEATFSKRMTSSMEADDDGSMRRGDGGGSVKMRDCDLVYEALFSHDYLSRFVKNMEQSTVVLKFGIDQPLLVHYPLGVADSFIRFVLAPKVAD